MAGMAVGSGSAIGRPVGGGTQIINGETYNQYSPEWYAAMRDGQVRSGETAGRATGAFANAALNGILPGGMGGTGTSSLPGGMGGSSSSSATGSIGGPGGGTPASLAGIDLPDQSGSNDAIFAKAKDAVGRESRAAITSLNDELGSQGMLGGGAQAQATKDIVSDAAGNEGQVTRDLASKNADMSADFAKTNYQGKITQRGQDIQSQEAAAQMALAREQMSQTNMYRLLQLATQGLSASYSPSADIY